MPNPELEAGTLDKRVTLLRPVYSSEFQDEITEDAESEPVYEPVTDVWASIQPAAGTIAATGERDASGRMAANNTILVVVRCRTDIDGRWRIGYRGRAFEILGITNPVERSAQLQIFCQEVL